MGLGFFGFGLQCVNNVIIKMFYGKMYAVSYSYNEINENHIISIIVLRNCDYFLIPYDFFLMFCLRAIKAMIEVE